MTDYRLRNHELLYSKRPRQMGRGRAFAIFISIVTVATLSVASYLVDRYNPAVTGFAVAIAKPEIPQPVVTTSSIGLTGQNPSRPGF